MNGQKPDIFVRAQSFICPLHQHDMWRVFDGKIPNSLGVLIRVTEEMIQLPEISAAAGGDTKQLTGVLAEFGPGCCYIGEERYLEILKEMAAAGVRAKDLACANCPESYASHITYSGPPPKPFGACLKPGCRCRGYVPDRNQERSL